VPKGEILVQKCLPKEIIIDKRFLNEKGQSKKHKNLFN